MSKRSTSVLILATALAASAGRSPARADSKDAEKAARAAAILAARLLLKDPLDKSCTDAGLVECQHLTEGVLLFVEGRVELGKQNLRDVAQANAPDQVRTVAQAITVIGGIPGAEKYLGPILRCGALPDGR